MSPINLHKSALARHLDTRSVAIIRVCLENAARGEWKSELHARTGCWPKEIEAVLPTWPDCDAPGEQAALVRRVLNDARIGHVFRGLNPLWPNLLESDLAVIVKRIDTLAEADESVISQPVEKSPSAARQPFSLTVDEMLGRMRPSRRAPLSLVREIIGRSIHPDFVEAAPGPATIGWHLPAQRCPPRGTPQLRPYLPLASACAREGYSSLYLHGGPSMLAPLSRLDPNESFEITRHCIRIYKATAELERAIDAAIRSWTGEKLIAFVRETNRL